MLRSLLLHHGHAAEEINEQLRNLLHAGVADFHTLIQNIPRLRAHGFDTIRHDFQDSLANIAAEFDTMEIEGNPSAANLDRNNEEEDAAGEEENKDDSDDEVVVIVLNRNDDVQEVLRNVHLEQGDGVEVFIPNPNMEVATGATPENCQVLYETTLHVNGQEYSYKGSYEENQSEVERVWGDWKLQKQFLSSIWERAKEDDLRPNWESFTCTVCGSQPIERLIRKEGGNYFPPSLLRVEFCAEALCSQKCLDKFFDNYVRGGASWQQFAADYRKA